MTIAALQALVDEEIPGIPRPPAPRIPRTPYSAKGTPMTTSPVPQSSASADVPLTVGALIAWAHAHTDKSIQRLAAQAHDALGTLRTRHHEEQELARVTAEETELEERLAEIRARKARLAPRRKPTRDYDPATVRTWARGKGLTVPDRGQIPAAVLAAWREHHPTCTGSGAQQR
ncbi:histone-like nucleoid-structuring protein Lsr2 [Streptomyces bacillaris]|uniref:Lsr2 family DNA-binding protein n=1 Tax=Streptomyces bacillaris TaxID=68179 RepID=UPI0036CDDCF4